MADASYYRDKAEQALRLARQNTDSMLVKSLTELAQHYLAQADATMAPRSARIRKMSRGLPQLVQPHPGDADAISAQAGPVWPRSSNTVG
jgi:hypothetical protein